MFTADMDFVLAAKPGCCIAQIGGSSFIFDQNGNLIASGSDFFAAWRNAAAVLRQPVIKPSRSYPALMMLSVGAVAGVLARVLIRNPWGCIAVVVIVSLAVAALMDRRR